jgi:hypothetical protein
MQIIDAHMHYADDDPEFLHLLEEFDLKFLNICFVHGPQDNWRAQAELYRTMTQAHGDRFAWCTSFPLPDLTDPTWADRAIVGLDQDFADGALACKVWKNIGMELLKPDGAYLLPDDPLFDPIYEHLASVNRSLLTHIAEPLECWLPLRPGSPHYGYYSNNPQWHMANRPEVPDHATLMRARDHIVAKHPTLRVIGAHLGSLEYDVDEVALRLDRYPNFAVDISARLVDLAVQPSDKVRDFFLRYADRILFGTDIVMRRRPSTLPPAERSAAVELLRQSYLTHFAYFREAGTVTVRDRQTQGLHLPDDVQAHFYCKNAQAWYPGI